jgi:hypothetical protein
MWANSLKKSKKDQDLLTLIFAIQIRKNHPGQLHPSRLIGL